MPCLSAIGPTSMMVSTNFRTTLWVKTFLTFATKPSNLLKRRLAPTLLIGKEMHISPSKFSAKLHRWVSQLSTVKVALVSTDSKPQLYSRPWPQVVSPPQLISQFTTCAVGSLIALGINSKKINFCLDSSLCKIFRATVSLSLIQVPIPEL